MREIHGLRFLREGSEIRVFELQASRLPGLRQGEPAPAGRQDLQAMRRARNPQGISGKKAVMQALAEILFAFLLGLARFALRNARSLLALALGAGSGLAFGASLGSDAALPKGVMLMYAIMGVAIVSPAVFAFLSGLFPKR